MEREAGRVESRYLRYRLCHSTLSTLMSDLMTYSTVKNEYPLLTTTVDGVTDLVVNFVYSDRLIRTIFNCI